MWKGGEERGEYQPVAGACVGQTEAGLQGASAPSSGSLLTGSSHGKQPLTTSVFLFLKWVNLLLRSTLKHTKYLCRYDHIVIKSRERFDEVRARGLLMTKHLYCIGLSQKCCSLWRSR